MSQSRSTIRFVCSNCTSPVEAKRRQAGTTMLCPWCHTRLTVPQESRPDGPVEVYELAGAATEAASRPAERTVSFHCSLCGTRMDAPADQVGRKVTCPDCGRAAVVPALSGPPLPASAVPVGSPVAGAADIYKVLEGQDQPPPTATEVYRRHIPVVCLLCHTRMHATEDQVGQTLVCPDCGTANVVPAVAASDVPAAPLAAVEGYHLAATADQPAAEASQNRQQFTFTCPLCRTRLQAARNEVGETMICPDCGTAFPIPRPPSEESQPDTFPEAAAYTVGVGQAETPAADRSPPPPPQQTPNLTAIAEARPGLADRDLLPPRRREHEVPPWPLVTGVFVFPFYRESLLCWGKMTTAALVIAVAWTVTAVLIRQLNQVGPGPPTLGAVMLSAQALYAIGFSTVLSGLIFAWISSSVLRILTETANGVDRIEEWAMREFAEWIFEALYLTNSLVLSLVIGWGIEFAASRLPFGSGAAASVFLLFPVSLLSMLETGTAMNPASPAVLGSFFRRWWAWLGFYALTAMMLTVAAGAALGLWLLAGPWSVIPSAILIAPAVMIYFRLLGRLGWCITAGARGREK